MLFMTTRAASSPKHRIPHRVVRYAYKKRLPNLSGNLFLCVYIVLSTTLKLAQEAYVVLGEKTQVLDTILEVGDTLYSKTESIARIDL